MNLKEGMYVRVSLDFENKQNPRVFALAQIQTIDEFGNIKVKFHKNFMKSEYDFIPDEHTYISSEIKRCKILNNTDCIDIESFYRGKIIIISKNKETNYYNYYIKTKNGIKEVSEEHLLVDFTKGNINPLEQMINYEFHNPFWYAQRMIPSEVLNILDNIDNNFSALISSRAYLFEHQIDTIIRALREEKCRLMFADEVGLGKTIEALVVLKGMNLDKALIIAPNSLVNQWKNEIEIKLWMESRIYNGKNISGKGILIVPVESLTKTVAETLAQQFDFCIIDEVHKYTNNKIYNLLLYICKNIDKIILLSATPIQERKEEYLKLLKLLKPSIYENMSELKFMNLYQKNSLVRKKVYSAYRDLEDFTLSDDEDEKEEIIEDIIMTLEDISNDINDSKLDKIFLKIENVELDEKIDFIKEALAYISESYQFEKNIIRHRRAEINHMLPSRSLELIKYEMLAGDIDVFEYDSYEAILEYLENITEKEAKDYKLLLLNSFFSSPHAIKFILEERLKFITKKKIIKEEIHFENEKIFSFKIINNEELIINNLLNIVQKWRRSVDYEIENIYTVLENPEKIKTRFGFLADYIDQELYDKKTVIFTSHNQTVKILYKLLTRLLGENSVVVFSENMSGEALESNALKFQNDSECKIIICDETGGEGRNFQIADAVIHFDLPFSPTILEQRIGRLDRIGRDKNKDVKNVVFISSDTVENDLFNIWNECFDIFEKSLSGLEIALEDIRELIGIAIVDDVRYGLNSKVDNIKLFIESIKSSVEEERYYDMARQLDYSTKEVYKKFIDKFDNEGGHLLASMMLKWGQAVGFEPEYIFDSKIAKFTHKSVNNKSFKNTMFDIPDTTKALKRGKVMGEITGTFDRDVAVNREDIVFFSPSEPIFDSIMDNVKEGFRGRCCAFIDKKASMKFNGFIFKWNVKFNINKLLENDIDLSFIKYSYNHMASNNMTSYIDVNENGIEEEKMKEYFITTDLRKKSNIVHLGKRQNQMIMKFKQINPQKQWAKLVNEAYKKAVIDVKEKYVNKLNVNKINEDFSMLIASEKVAINYYEKDGDLEKFKTAIKKVREGILNPTIELDSVVYVRLNKTDE